MRNMPNLTTSLLLALAGLLGCGPVAAQGDLVATDEASDLRQYAVEIILFRYADGVSAGGERFVPDPPPEDEYLRDPDDSTEDEAVVEYGDLLPPPVAAPRETETLEEIVLPSVAARLAVMPRQRLALREQYDKLVLLDAYQPVLWAGWTQLAVERDLAPGIPLRRLGNVPADFDGELKLYLSRFLHLVVDITLSETRGQALPSAERFGDRRVRGMPPADVARVRMHIDEDRIVKDGDLRYFDHPKFGLLAKVTRIEQEDDTLNDDDDALPAR